ncbi:DNA polymerase III subunit alpha [Plantactinospora sp. CA-290183]|uniref:DNA polymerase III subunit alpha n=1 Tax=Plantactinospora sp. CA-290183 TaxID=3240006 RepID=UPI003D8E2112
MSDSFVHLHVHTEYSMLDGAAKLGPLFKEAERLGMPAVAMTDHGNMFGAYSFVEAAKSTNVKPIVGIEAYLAPHDRFHKKPVFWGGPGDRRDDISGGGAYTHMTMVAETAEGLRNLFKLSSLASIEGYYYKPRMDRELIARHAAGVIATTGCPSGEVQTRLRLGQDAEALQAAADYRDIFGADNFFLELMDHGLDIERRVREGLLDVGRKLNLNLLATNDSHYVTQDQAKAHDALLCIQSGSTLDDPNRFRFDGDGYYLKSPEEMRKIFDGDLRDACLNTLLIAERIQPYDEAFAFNSRMPEFPVPDGETQGSWLRKETERGLSFRFPDGVPPEYVTRADYELGIIEQMGFPAYFLVVADLLRHARSQKIRYAPGRGSATGCLVAYALQITELDPIHHGLIFERFLNPERVSMPDIDLDFDERRRGEMIRYTTEVYGDDRVCQIVTFGTIKTKAALKDASRVLGYPFAMGERLTKAMPPPVMAKDIPIAGMIDPDHPRYGEAAEFRALIESDPDARRVFDTALGLEGLIRQPGVHAAGVILSKDPLLDILPVWRRDQDGAIISGWDYPSCEAIGLLKMDYLGLRNLTVIDDAVNNVRRTTGNPDFNVSAHKLEDSKTYELLASGETLGVFQLDGGPMRALLKAMAPTNFVDIAAVLALYRPGPMAANAHIDYADRKNGRKPVVPIHREFAETLADILDPTYGLIVFQEQVLAIARKVAGYSLGQADLLRRAMGKKKKEILDKEFIGFEAGMKANGYSDEAIKTLWDILLPFAGYAFNKSHTAGYGIISFWTAFLKANYPAEYMAALLTSVGDAQDKMAVYLAECRRMGIRVLPPDVNDSDQHFTPVGMGEIRFGLGAVRNVGANVVESIVRTRNEKGAYTSFADFLDKVELVACNKRTVESLIKAGAFDSLGHTRRGLLSVHADAIDSHVGLKKNQQIGQYDLFGEMMPTDDGNPAAFAFEISDREWDRKEKLAFEREMLGLYVSDHPLAGAERILRKNSDTAIASIGEETPDRAKVIIAGMIASVERRITKDGKPWAIIKVEDLSGTIEVLFFAKTYELFGTELAPDRIVAVQGNVNHRDGATSIFGSDLKILEFSEGDLAAHPPLVIVLPVHRVVPQLAGSLKRVLEDHPGKTTVRVKLRGDGQRVTLLELKGFAVEPSVSLLSELKALLGAGCLE